MAQSIRHIPAAILLGLAAGPIRGADDLSAENAPAGAPVVASADPKPASGEPSIARPAPEVPPAPVPAMVRALGAASFQTREAAEQALLDAGAVALPYLYEAADSADLEIRYRARRLIERLERLTLEQGLEGLIRGEAPAEIVLRHGWERFARTVGDSPESRQLFGSMMRHYSPLLLASADATDELPSLLNHHMRLMNDAFNRRFDNDVGEISLDLVATLMFVATDPGHEYGRGNVPTLFSRFESGILESRIARYASDAGGQILRQLAAEWITAAEGIPPQTRMSLAMRLRLRAGLDAALQVLDESARPETLEYALLTIAALGNREHITRLMPLLEDRRDIPQRVMRGSSEYSCLVSDVALVAILTLTDQSPREYGFPRLEEDRILPYRPGTAGFSNEQQRRQAFGQWSAWQRRNLREWFPPPESAVEGVTI